MYDKIFSRIEKDPKLEALKMRPNDVVYFYKDEIGHPESILVTLSPTGEYRIFELPHQYDEKDQIRGRRAYFGVGGEGKVCFGRDIKTGEIVAVKKGNGIGKEYPYQIATELQAKSIAAGIEPPIIDIYAYGYSSTKPGEKRKTAVPKKNQTFYSIMKMGLRNFGDSNYPQPQTGNLDLSLDQKTKIIIDALNFSLLLKNNNTYYQDFKSRNALVDSEHRLKICDIEGFHPVINQTFSSVHGVSCVLSWIYDDVNNEKAEKQIKGKQKELIDKINKRKITQFSDINEDLIKIIRETIEACDLIVTDNGIIPLKETQISQEKISRRYNDKDSCFADLQYYVTKRQPAQIIELLYRMQNLNLTKIEQQKIEAELMNMNDETKSEFIKSLLDHPKLLFLFQASIMAASMSENQKISLLQKIDMNYLPPKELVENLVKNQFKNSQQSRHDNSIEGETNKLKALYPIDNMVNSIQERCPAHYESNVFAQIKSTIQATELSYFKKVLVAFLKDEEKHPPHAKAFTGSLFLREAVNKRPKDDLMRRAEIKTDAAQTYEHLIAILNEYLRNLLNNLSGVSGTKPQNTSRYLNAFKDFLGIDVNTVLDFNHFNEKNIKGYIQLKIHENIPAPTEPQIHL